MSALRTCPACQRSLPLTGANFYRCASDASGFQHRCKACDRTARLPAPPGFVATSKCKACAGQAHRRPVTGCPKCKLPYQAEKPISAVDASVQGHGPTYPTGGDFRL